MKKTILTMMTLSMPFSICAGELGSAGFEGEITALMGMTSQTSNFNTEQEVKTGSLNTEGESDSEFLAAPLGQVRYTFGANNNHQILAGTSRADITVGDFALELGYKMALGERSSLAFSYLPSLGGETWADPHVVDQAREETDLSSDAFRIKYDRIFDSNFSADIAYYTVDIDEEKSWSHQSGNHLSSLDRNGNGLYSKFSYTYAIDRSSMLESAILYKGFSADGDAMSNDQLGFELSYRKGMGNHGFVLTAKYKISSFDEVNPVFNKEQDDSQVNFFAAYEYSNFMDWDNVAFNAIAGYEDSSSNIDFYDSSSYIIGLGMTYKF